MTPEEFRGLALALDGSVEGAHGGHADFRVGGRVFATLGHPRPGYAAVMLTPDEQSLVIERAGDAAAPAAGAWGAKGSTILDLAALDETVAEAALRAAWSARASGRRRR